MSDTKYLVIHDGEIIIETAGCLAVNGTLVDGYDCTMVEFRS